MIKCYPIFDGTLQKFYEEHKDIKDYQLMGYFVLVDWQIGHYYGVELNDGTKQVLKCVELRHHNYGPVFVSGTTPIAGPINIIKILWEKSEEEMFKPDCRG